MRAGHFTARGDRVVSPGLKTRPTSHCVVSPGSGGLDALECHEVGLTGCRAGLQTRRMRAGHFTARSDGVVPPGLKTRPTSHCVVSPGSGGLDAPECRE